MTARMLTFITLVLIVACSNVFAIDPSICIAGGKVVFYESGSLRSCDLKDDYQANGIRCHNGNRISFYQNGNVESCILSERTTVGGNECGQFVLISFYPDGKLKSCVKPVE